MIDHWPPRNKSSTKHSRFIGLFSRCYTVVAGESVIDNGVTLRDFHNNCWRRRDTSSFLVWITLGFSWVLPLVLGLDAWLFSLHLQSCEAIILQRSREVSANYLKSWDCEAVGLLLRKIQVIHRQIIMEWDSKDERQKMNADTLKQMKEIRNNNQKRWHRWR